MAPHAIGEHTGAMTRGSGPRRLIAFALLVGLAALAVVVTRLALGTVAGGRGWFLAAFLAVFVVARLGGARAGFATTVVLAVVTLARLVTRTPDTPDTDVVMDAAVDAATGVVAVGLGLLARGDPRAEEGRRQEAARTLARADAAIAREQAIRELAEEVSTVGSPRQIADAVLRRFEALLLVRAAVVLAREDSDVWAVRDDAGLGSSPVLGERGIDPDLATARRVAAEVLGTGRQGGMRDGRDADDVLGIPLPAGDGLSGSVGLVLARPAALDDVALAGYVTLGRIAGEALARAADARRSRRSAEREARALDRVGRLQRLAADLARPLDARSAGAIVVDAASAGVGAPVVVLHRVMAGHARLELLAARGYPGGLLAAETHLPLDAMLPVTEAARTGRRVEVEAGEWARRFPAASDVPAITGIRHLVAIPAGDPHATAVLVVSRSGGGAFEPDELDFLGTIAEQAGQAIERAELLEALRERGRRLDLTLGAAGTGTWEIELDAGTLAVSEELRRVHGIDPDERLPDLEAYLARIEPDDRRAVRAAIERVSERPGDFSVEFRTVRPDGSVAWINSVGRSFADETGRPRRVTATDRDVTLDRLAEAERERLLQQEREARRLQEAFVGVMSHELRTPITTIIAGTQLLLRYRDMPSGALDLAEDVGDEAERLYRLVEDLLVLSRLERGNLAPEREPVHVGHLIERVVTSEEARWPGRTFRVTRGRGNEVVEGEDTYVEQVLRNLLSNAAKYSGSGSTVEVVVEHTDDAVIVRVLDEGPGIAADEVGDLFTLFYRSPTTAAAASGAGIGLFVCDRLVRAMGGRIWARRRETTGSEFGFALTRYEDAEASVMPARPVDADVAPAAT